MQFLFFTGFFILAIYIGLAWFLANKILFPESSLVITQSIIQEEWGTTYEKMIAKLPQPTDFSITSFDGISLKGKYFSRNEKAKCVIIAAHGWTDTWAGMLKYVPALEDCSCDLLLYDHRGHGLSDKAYPTGGIRESKDLLKITEWVEKNKGFGEHEIGWLGSSWGGSAALKAGETGKKIGFIIADAAFQDWYSAIFERAERDYGAWTRFLSVGIMKIVSWRAGIDYKEASPLNAVKKIEIPILLIHSKMDNATNSQQSINISKNLNEKSVFHHLTWGGDHTLDVVVHKDKFKALINNFLEKVDSRFLK